jgi:hypothetical protein
MRTNRRAATTRLLREINMIDNITNSLKTSQGRDATIGLVGVRVISFMQSFREAMREQFAGAARGEHRTFETSGAFKTRAVIRELLNIARDDVFIFASRFNTDVHPASAYREMMGRTHQPRVRIMIDPAADGEPTTMLDELRDLIAPTGPIEVRRASISSPVHVMIVDQKHMRIEKGSDRETSIVDLADPAEAIRSVTHLETLWPMATPLT